MTFTLPEDLALQFVRRIPARERSRYLAEALSEKLRARDRLLIEACRTANTDPDVRAIEKEFDAIKYQRTAPAVGGRRTLQHPGTVISSGLPCR
jgi:hypothetical protein